jgi:Mg2+-importing ATPase
MEEDEKDLEFMGYFSFVDPLKKTAKEVICLSGKMGLKIKILTGDSKEVAGYVAKEVGLIETGDEVMLGEDLLSLAPEKFEQACEKFSVFARVSPQTKFRIIQALQKKFEVGFLGEGINDAPALKIANVAIAVKEGADISREVSDIILLEKDLRTIVNGIKEGRSIFSNINKYIKCTLASNFGNFYSIAAISLFIPFLPMLPIQILLVNLLSDFPLIAVTTDRVDVRELKRPKAFQLQGVVVLVIFLALVSTVFDFLFFGIFHKLEPSLLQSLWFIESIITEILLIFSVRTSKFFLKAKRPSFPLLFLSVMTILVTTVLPFTKLGREFFHFASPSIPQLMIVFSLLTGYLIISEAVKLLYFKRFNHKSKA